MNIRIARRADAKKGLLETLKNLSDLEGITPKEAEKIIFEISGKRSGVHMFVAESEEKVVGTITLIIEQKIIHNGGKVAHIEDVAVRSGYEKSGIGTKLVQHALDTARREGCYKVVLNCQYHIIPFYQKLGFEKVEVCMRYDLD